MKSVKILPALIIITMVVNIIPTIALASGHIWLFPHSEKGGSMEFVWPNYEHDDRINFPTGSLLFTGMFQLKPDNRLIFDLPIGLYSYDNYDGESESETDLGNIYLGWEKWKKSSLVEIGLRLPVAGSNAVGLLPGWYGDLDRTEAYQMKTMSILTNYNYLSRSSDGLTVRLRGGFSTLIFTDDNAHDGAELIGRYAIQVWQDERKICLGAGISGYTVLSEEGSFNERSWHELGLVFQYQTQSVHPGLSLRLPLDDDLGNVIQFVATFSLSYFPK